MAAAAAAATIAESPSSTTTSSTLPTVTVSTNGQQQQQGQSTMAHTSDSVWSELEHIFDTIGTAPYFEEPGMILILIICDNYMQYMRVMHDK
jgi:hypothetical protein